MVIKKGIVIKQINLNTNLIKEEFDSRIYKLVHHLQHPFFVLTYLDKNIRSHNNFDDKDDSCQQILPILNNHYFLKITK